ncbi:helix-turn-helix domain-containing protein [Aquabacterium sp.]|uniref:helix-turn-helix domain-containing protein n=1 Tax=Aquabacterium sp. TaxID=1872578 RepID=UPI004037CFD3
MQKTIYSTQHQVLLDLLRQARTERAVTQQELSQRIGMSQSDISKVERGVRRLDILELRVWLAGLEVPLASFAKTLDAKLSAAEAVARQASGRKKT